MTQNTKIMGQLGVAHISIERLIRIRKVVSSLKSQNNLRLLAAIGVNLAVLYGAIQSDTLFGGGWLALAQGLPEALPAGFGLILISVINAQLSPEAKARIVFLRWNNALPGCEAFTRYASSDRRIGLQALKRKFGPLPRSPSKQNALWYEMYKSVETEPSVTQAHREYLFTRDYHCLALMMLFLLGVAAFVQIPSTGTAFSYLGLLFIQFLLTGRAARNHGKAFVATVMAVKAAGQ